MIAIVGGGAAGMSAAEALRELGYDGELRLLAAEPAPPYERPALSKRFLVDRQLDEPPALRPPSALAELGIAPDVGVEAVAIESAERLLLTARGEQLRYDRLLLATGAEPRRLELPGASLRGVHYLRELADARTLRADLWASGEVAIVGGGVIGLEVAASAARLGAAVTVLEVAPQVMGRIVPEGFAQLLADLHRARGVAIRTAVRPIGFEGSDGRVRGVRLADDALVPAQTVVVGVGAIPRTGLAARAGLTVDDGIVVDERFASGDERIFAAGDAARVLHAREDRHVRLEQWQAAEDQGRHAAASMLGLGEPYCDVPWMWSDQGDLHVQATGFGFDGAEIVRRGALDERAGVALLGVRDGELVAACGVSVGAGVGRTIRAAQRLIEHRVPVDAERLADPAVELRRLARAHSS
jgi:3-phenylpropionate/trans-cinnamate dioxygenase ferredoxin reductase subunit